MDQEKYPFLADMEKTFNEKDLNAFQEQLITDLSLNGFTTDEVAALLFSTMKIVLSQKENKQMLQKNFNIDIEKLGAEGVLAVQQALLEGYLVKNNFVS
ncbi:hypothetical protein LZ578_08660 [Jeotgalibaca sp. MA1X17-3]|uniref:hypothetical protein n=1 Tax=Jeotgalibaca sp. MA1X17-3 TaxID=2908211 RepID=UPI001F4004F2|nr:hypothetical protein [Jeotgalibaca sp. MA1X17-3]UJF15069.1 hypothetical protein LZ578_08660 [Jeotgalibaca sp. MA1X17-3]